MYIQYCSLFSRALNFVIFRDCHAIMNFFNHEFFAPYVSRGASNVQWIETTPIELALPLYSKYLISKIGVRDWCRLIMNNFYHENNIWKILTKSRNLLP